VQTPDSFGKEVDRILAKCEEKSDNYKYVLWYTARQAENSKVMGMDEAFLYLVEKYYLQGKAYWLQDSDIKKYKEAAEKLSNNTIGKQAQEIAILDTKNMPISLRQLASQKDYTVVAFYDPTCGHCQKEIPRVDSVLRIMYKKGKKIQVFAINNSNEDEKWRNFIVDKKLNDFWIHAWDPQHTSRYRKDYNVYSNPIFYLIDREGKIIGKRLDHSNLEDFIQFYEKKIAAEKKAG
jgi:peroxiredoxin